MCELGLLGLYATVSCVAKRTSEIFVGLFFSLTGFRSCVEKTREGEYRDGRYIL